MLEKNIKNAIRQLKLALFFLFVFFVSIMASSSNCTAAKSEKLDVKIEPDLLSPVATRKKKKRTIQNETEQQSIAKRRIVDWPSDEAGSSPETQQHDDELEQVSESLSRVEMNNTEDQGTPGPSSSSPVMASLAIGNVPCISDTQHPTTPYEETPFSSSETQEQRPNDTLDLTASTLQHVLEPDQEQEPKVRKITDFFSKVRSDHSKSFTPLSKAKREPNAGPSISKSSQKKPSKPKATAVGKKMKTPATMKPPARTTTTSRRLIKPDPEEMSDNDDLMSEEEPSSSKRATTRSSNGTTTNRDNNRRKRFVRSSPPAAAETNMSMSQIKALLERIKQGTEPDIFDPKYYCQACPRIFDGQKTFHNHMHSKHGVNLEERKFIVLTYGPKPNITDESMFCKQCQKQYVSKERFQHHNEVHHGFERAKVSIVAHRRRKGQGVKDNDDQERELAAQEKMDTLEQTEKKNKQATLKDLENHRNCGYYSIGGIYTISLIANILIYSGLLSSCHSQSQRTTTRHQ